MARSRINALANMKCPRCHEGDMFTNKNMYNLNTIHQMPETCLVCSEPLTPEPGFYYGAMYVNYGIATTLFFISWGITLWYGFDIWVYMFIYIATILLITPILFRYSRVIYLYFFVNYREDAHRVEK